MRHDAFRSRDWVQASRDRRAARLAALEHSVRSTARTFGYGSRHPRRPRAKHASTQLCTSTSRYFDGLFGHPRALDDSGQVVSVVDRTNDRAEHVFSDGKRKLRRHLEHANLAHDMHDQRAQIGLAANWLDKRYVQSRSGTLEKLPAAFSRLGQTGFSHRPLQSSIATTGIPDCADGSAGGS